MKRSIKHIAEWVIARSAPLAWRLRRVPRLLVLMYHRVLPEGDPDRQIEQPGMFVSPATLDMHLTVLREHFELVHLNEWLHRASAGESLPERACALTFDDGWLDNYVHGFPVLKRHGAPATIFIVSTLTGTNTEFWPNRLARVLTSVDPSELPNELATLLEPVLSRARSAGVLCPDDLDAAIRLAKQVSEADIHRMLDQAQQRTARAACRRAVLNKEELRAMAASGLVRYGSHTRTHYRCREGAPTDVLEMEIRDSREEIAASVGQEVELFCYPNGDFTSTAVELVSHYYSAAVTTRRGWYRLGSSRFLIPRIGVHEDIANTPDSFLARISGWL